MFIFLWFSWCIMDIVSSIVSISWYLKVLITYDVDLKINKICLFGIMIDKLLHHTLLRAIFTDCWNFCSLTSYEVGVKFEIGFPFTCKPYVSLYMLTRRGQIFKLLRYPNSQGLQPSNLTYKWLFFLLYIENVSNVSVVIVAYLNCQG